MIWLYILIYFLGAIGTGLCVYILLIKKYIKENTALQFNVWFEEYDLDIIYLATFWLIALPISVMVYSIKAIVKQINKHYNI